jgi:ketosteroid isomerase-like protein
MSEENVETARRLFESAQESFERGDPGAWIDSDAVSEDYEWVLAGGLMRFDLGGRTVFRGREGFEEFFRTWMAEFDEYSFEVDRLIDPGDDRVVVIAHQRGVGKGSGAPIEWQMGQVLEFEGGRLIRTRNYGSPAEALEAAGLSE